MSGSRPVAAVFISAFASTSAHAISLDESGLGEVLAYSADVGGTNVHRLPVTSFMVYTIIDSNAAPGRLANYGGAFAHRAGVAHAEVPAGVSE
jgi:hypothetical protein